MYLSHSPLIYHTLRNIPQEYIKSVFTDVSVIIGQF